MSYILLWNPEIWMEEKNFCIKEYWHRNAKQSLSIWDLGAQAGHNLFYCHHTVWSEPLQKQATGNAQIFIL